MTFNEAMQLRTLEGRLALDVYTEFATSVGMALTPRTTDWYGEAFTFSGEFRQPREGEHYFSIWQECVRMGVGTLPEGMLAIADGARLIMRRSMMQVDPPQPTPDPPTTPVNTQDAALNDAIQRYLDDRARAIHPTGTTTWTNTADVAARINWATPPDTIEPDPPTTPVTWTTPAGTRVRWIPSSTPPTPKWRDKRPHKKEHLV